MSRPSRNPNRDFEELLSDLSARLDHLKAQYEQWFQGFERLPPVRQREKLERDLKRARKGQPLNTALKFRFQTLWQRWTTLSTHWARVTRQIEEGTYYRDVQRMKRRRKKREQRREEQKAVAAMEIDVDLDNFDLDAEIGAAMDALQAPSPEPLPDEKTEPNITLPGAASAAPPAPPAALKQARRLSRHADAVSSMPPPVPKSAASRVSKGAMDAAASLPPPTPKKKRPAPPKPPARAGGSGPSDAEMRRLYDEYVKARRKNKERVDNLKFEKLAKQIRKTVPKLQEKHKGKKIGFEVVVRNGRVGLKPVTED